MTATVGGRSSSAQEAHGTFDTLDLLVRVDSNNQVVAQRTRLQRLRVNIAEKCYWRRLEKGTWRNALAWPKWKRSKHPSTQLRESVTIFTCATAGGDAHSDLLVLLVVPYHVRHQKIHNVTALQACNYAQGNSIWFKIQMNVT
jgi:hypothetical protein